MMRIAMLLLAGHLITTTSAFAAPIRGIITGDWEFSVDYDLMGISQTFPSYKVRACISDKNPFPDISRPGQECQAQMRERFGRTYTWMMNCSTSWEMVQGMGRMHYHNDWARGDVHLQILNPHNPPQHMVFRINGRYMGPCEPAE